MSIIQCGTTTTTALVQTGDTNGNLVIQTGSTPTTAMTVSSSQIVNFANAPTVGGAPLPSGAMSLISTQTASSSASIQWTGLSTFNRYLLIFDGVHTSGFSSIYLQFGYGSSPTWVTSLYQFSGNYTNTTPVTTSKGSASYSGIPIDLGVGNMGFGGGAATVNIYNLLGSTYYPSATFSGSDDFGDNYQGNGTASAPAQSYNAIRLIQASGNITAGTFSLYGISS
jgi:hypothetical protein